jgi:hypothetical protein
MSYAQGAGRVGDNMLTDAANHDPPQHITPLHHRN